MITFRVYGVPRPGGSKTAFRTKTGKTVYRDASKHVGVWRAAVALAAAEAGVEPIQDGPIRLAVVFIMPRPKGHFRTGKHAGELKPDAPTWHTNKPDRTKLLRSTEDALTGIAWRDDTQVVAGPVMKIYADPGQPAGAQITIERIEDR